MNKLLLALALACLAGLWLNTGTAHAQYPSSNFNRYRPPGGGARLSPYLNLANGGDPAINYYSGTLPELQRRYDETIFTTRIRGLEQRQRELFDRPASRIADDIIPPVPTAGQPIGSRTSGSYFRQDSGGIGTHRAPRLR